MGEIGREMGPVPDHVIEPLGGGLMDVRSTEEEDDGAGDEDECGGEDQGGG